MSARAGLRLRVAALSILAAGCAAETNPEVARRVAEDAARDAITATSLAFADAFRTGDVATLMATVSDDIVLTTVSGTVHGRVATEESWRSFFETGSVTSLDVRPEPLLIDGDIAVEAGEYDETVVIADAAPMEISGSYVMIWVREADGQWRIRRFTAVDHDAPAPDEPGGV